MKLFLLFNFIFCENRNTYKAVKRSINNPDKDEFLIPIPNFTSGEWEYTETVEIISATQVRVPPGLSASKSIRYTTNLQDYPNLSYQYFVNNCPATTQNDYPSEVLCYVDIYNFESPLSTDPQYALLTVLGHEEEFTLPGKPYNIGRLTIFLQNLGTESVIFSLPELMLRSYIYERADYIEESEGKVVVNIKEGDEYQLSTLFLENPFPLPPNSIKYEFQLPRLPIIANSTHIVGVDIEFTNFFIPWDFVIDNTANFFLNLTARRDFSISFYVLEVETTSYLDALEKWHDKFPHIYHHQEFGVGCWVSFYFDNNRDDLDTNYFVKFFWGTYVKYKNYPMFGYVEPSCYHISNMSIGNTPEITKQKLEECLNDETNEGREKCYLALHYTPRYSNGSFVSLRNEKETWNDGIFGNLRMEEFTYHYYFDQVLDTIIKDDTINGLGLDSFNIDYDSYQVENEDPFLYVPFLLNDKKKNKYLPSIVGLFWALTKADQNLSTYGKNYFMSNTNTLYPQYIKYIQMGGFETDVFENWGDHQAHNFFTLRYCMGSRALSVLENTDNSRAYTRTEKYFSICASLGIFPSYFTDIPGEKHFWESETDLEAKRDDYKRWGTVLNYTLDHTYYRANRLGRLNFVVETVPFEISKLSTVSMFCNKENEKCFIWALIAGKGKMEINVNDKVPLSEAKLLFTANNLEVNILNNNITLRLNDVEDDDAYRAACVELDFNMENQPSIDKKGLSDGEIAGIVIAVVAAIAIACVLIYVFVIRKKNDKSSSN
ncbi:hypothetical protein GPJ56_009595 [Histomonas meleagridis]|uniref:uncharacterized protein n=1 Tax=Histomonas meleagridis TaxID=135588 RepID=UPI00355A867E|nr:hypothetical protein GPJ56_009595 [Histomonas meleagridis]KAH0799637.1 hypothetical protein GO595_007551 [Histomonas meleagridis]